MKDRYQVFALVEKLSGEDGDLVLVSGGCRKGADTFAEEAAKAYGVPMVVHKPDLSKPFRFKAEPYFARNKVIAEDSQIVYAWVAPDRSGGTENTISHARDLKRQIFVVDGEGNIYLDQNGMLPPCDPVAHL